MKSTNTKKNNAAVPVEATYRYLIDRHLDDLFKGKKEAKIDIGIFAKKLSLKENTMCTIHSVSI